MFSWRLIVNNEEQQVHPPGGPPLRSQRTEMRTGRVPKGIQAAPNSPLLFSYSGARTDVAVWSAVEEYRYVDRDRIVKPTARLREDRQLREIDESRDCSPTHGRSQQKERRHAMKRIANFRQSPRLYENPRCHEVAAPRTLKGRLKVIM